MLVHTTVALTQNAKGAVNDRVLYASDVISRVDAALKLILNKAVSSPDSTATATANKYSKQQQQQQNRTSSRRSTPAVGSDRELRQAYSH
jgi:hypothetical protein